MSLIDRVIIFHSTSQFRAHIKASKSSKKLMVIDFSASWCGRGPCRYTEPLIIELADKYSEVDFIKIDVDELPAVSRDFGIQAMPTFVLLKNGKEVDKVVGANMDELQWKLRSIELSTETMISNSTQSLSQSSCDVCWYVRK
ncbi:unnamed protein product [Rhodiola kirilowii]